MRPLPESIEAECGVLGSLIIDPEAFVTIMGKIAPDDFYRDAHRIIFETFLQLVERHEPADPITLRDELEKCGKLDEVGGASYLTSLINCVPTSGNIEYYAQIVSRKASFRRLIHTAGKIAAFAYDEEPDALVRAEKMIFALSQKMAQKDFFSAHVTVAEVISDLNALYTNAVEITGIPSGFDDLDKVIGGWQASDLILLAARPGAGKTSLALALALHAAMYAGNVAMVSLEMSAKQLIQRLLAMLTGKDLRLLRTARGMEFDDWEPIVLAGDKVSESRLWIDDEGGQDIDSLCTKLRRLHAEHTLSLIVVDYLQLLHAKINGRRLENPVQEVSEISGKLKALAKELNVPLLALSQLSRDVEGRQKKIPQLSDLRQSGSLEQDADIVMFIYREDMYVNRGDGFSERPGEGDIIISKHRNGPTGEVTLFFYGPTTCFFNAKEEARKRYGKLKEEYEITVVVDEDPKPPKMLTPQQQYQKWQQSGLPYNGEDDEE